MQENLIHFGPEVQSHLLVDLETVNNPKFMATLSALKDHPMLKSASVTKFAEERFQSSQATNETLLYLAAFNHDANYFTNLIDSVNEEFYDLALKEFNLPAKTAISYISNHYEKLLPYLISFYRESDEFNQALVAHVKKTERYDLLFCPISVFDYLKTVP